MQQSHDSAVLHFPEQERAASIARGEVQRLRDENQSLGYRVLSYDEKLDEQVRTLFPLTVWSCSCQDLLQNARVRSLPGT